MDNQEFQNVIKSIPQMTDEQIDKRGTEIHAIYQALKFTLGTEHEMTKEAAQILLALEAEYRKRFETPEAEVKETVLTYNEFMTSALSGDRIDGLSLKKKGRGKNKKVWVE
jgi:hypothetical protein